MKKTISTFIICSVTLPSLIAQKKPIDHSSYDLWKNISSVDVSKSGNYIFYTVSPQEGDGYIDLKDKKNNLLQRFERGTSPKMTKREDFLITLIKPPFKDTREAKIKKKKSDDFPKDSLAIFNINSQSRISLGAIKSYKLAYYPTNFIAYTQELNSSTTTDSLAVKTDSTASKSPKKSGIAKKENVLILQQLQTKDTVQFRKTDSYLFSNDEKYLVFSKKTETKDSSNADGLYIYDLAKKSLKKISNGKGVYKNMTFDDQSNRLSFLADKSPEKALQKDFRLYLYHIGQDTAHVIADKNTKGIPSEWHVSGDGQLNFDESSKRLFFGLAPIPAVKDTTLVDFENAKVDIWHWKDDYLMTQQLVNLKKDMSKSYDAVYNLETNQLIALTDDTFDRTAYTDAATQEWILATSSLGNRIAYQWQAFQLQQIYAISTRTGERKSIKSDWQGQAFLSPDANYIVLFDETEGNWYSHHIASGTEQLLNKGLNVKFADEENDMPTAAAAYGIAAWAEDNRGIYINDRYDVWYFSLDGKTQKSITNQFGRANAIVLRPLLIKDGTPRDRTTKIKDNTTLLLTSFNEKSKENGIFSLLLSKKQNPTEILQDKFTFKNFKTDDKSNIYVYTKENYTSSPDLYSTTDFKVEQRLTDINPQQREYNWGTAELVKWTTPHGYPAEGILYKPENFDPNKKYPIIAYFYERLSQGLYSYQAPAPTPSRLNIPYFVSNEYLVFAPDIRYQTGHPGRSAEEYINSGMRYLAKNNWVDSTKMAIQGQSWGGYQVAHLITRTNMYAAAWTGAPVVNMTSAYGGIRWGTGMSRQFQYEKTQSRLGATLWEDRELYIENSPLFFMDKVNTPVAIMHNDNDGAVPWYQGIEMFTALRRLGKPAWLLNYNGDDHNLIQRQNRKDIQIRQSQFFDHFLKGKPAAEWIKSGVKATNKGTNWGFSTE
ncbi:S9 family peptidase [Sphingobacterium tabacisoli]|uniref:Prolyl oligopeptidase family serine peptidase n=1 Tax=Sphingobacterium tabacisoli TaxID=2044855 RepID=A0ABW5L4S5_9SPHI|nr:prolyl oligopeptidase family serine peptidase [Sphingobacterium tabacisoli]